MNTLLSDALQWDIIEELAEVHPWNLTREEFSEYFGDVDEYMMVVNIMQLIEEGIINPRAIIRRLKGPAINITALLLTPYGYQLARPED